MEPLTTPSTPPRPAGRGVLARRAGTLALGAASVVAVVVLARRVEGLDLGERLRGADTGAVAAAALLSLVPLLGNVLSMLALSPVRLPFGRTGALWLSTSFLNLLTPASTGGVALTVRYLQRQGGLPLAVAATTIGLVQSTSALVTAVLVLLSLLAAGRGGAPGVQVPWPVAGAALVAAGAAALAVARWPRARRELRERVVAPVRREWPALRRALTHPGRLALA
ncbi:lysylphosphatidylglycerol synthase domain-containing protein, partial [Kineococcus indalonis]|uniref:lysylphosphatidylglycerol synthase domain-containing protein n=1 Tax=Kineococcus indalonis TaxID=2696566 RepID=UPI00196B22B2